MKINGNELEKIYNPVKTENNLNNSERAKSRNDKLTDRITFSKKAKEFSSVSGLTKKVVEKVVKQTPPDKLLKLKSEISAGKYRVSAEEISDAILGLPSKDC